MEAAVSHRQDGFMRPTRYSSTWPRDPTPSRRCVTVKTLCKIGLDSDSFRARGAILRAMVERLHVCSETGVLPLDTVRAPTEEFRNDAEIFHPSGRRHDLGDWLRARCIHDA